MEAMISEVTKSAGMYRNYRVETIFFGGGTPSLPDAAWMEKLMDAVKKVFSVSDNAEITIECNPGTTTEEKLCTYRKAGINRISFGLQSANEEELRSLGRIHNWQQFSDGYRMAREAGFENINVDIMSALPNQTIDSYRQTLERVLDLEPQPEHISAYSLIVEEGTPFYEMDEKGELSLPSEEDERQMYALTEEILKKYEYHRYEISNYAKEGYECRHNCGYWRRREYLGFGIGAASLIEEQRFRNGTDLQEYIRQAGITNPPRQKVTFEEQMEEFMFLGLRMTSGVDVEEFRVLFGKSMDDVYGPVIEKNVRDGLLKYVCDGNRNKPRLVLTAKGLDISNYVMAQFLLD